MKTSEPQGVRDTVDETLRPTKRMRTMDLSGEFNQEKWADLKLRLVTKEDDSIEYLWAHRLVLRLESGFFRTLLSTTWDTEECKEKTVSFDTNVQRQAFVRLVECFYTGQAPVRPIDEWYDLGFVMW